MFGYDAEWAEDSCVADEMTRSCEDLQGGEVIEPRRLAQGEPRVIRGGRNIPRAYDGVGASEGWPCTIRLVRPLDR